MAALEAQPPELIFAGYPPFPALRAFLSEALSALAAVPPGLWVRRGAFGRFEVAEASTPAVRSAAPSAPS